ncbi:hypothetical protein, partial [Brevundimonas sp.]|uniref:hypothetical protein n=1 Tax=Brevundimonas sp. TaxID=1871086 RepID=UPI003D6D17CB
RDDARPGRRRRGGRRLADGDRVNAMTRYFDRILEPELLDEEAWAAPERLTPDDCFDQLGSDWRRPAAPGDQEDEG